MSCQGRPGEGEQRLGADLEHGQPEEAEDESGKTEPAGPGGLEGVKTRKPDQEDQAPE